MNKLRRAHWALVPKRRRIKRNLQLFGEPELS
jgi:hypothetical protein